MKYLYTGYIADFKRPDLLVEDCLPYPLEIDCYSYLYCLEKLRKNENPKIVVRKNFRGDIIFDKKCIEAELFQRYCNKPLKKGYMFVYLWGLADPNSNA